MRARNPLYIQAKPPPHVQAQITALQRNDPSRGADLLHATLVSLFDLHYAPPEWLAKVIAALDSFDGPAFPLAFDRIENRKAVTLRTRAPLAEARAFQAALLRHLLERKAPMMLGTTPEPHVTINYRGDRLGSQKIAAVGWTVDEILLVESVVGKTIHIEHGRWPLRANPAWPTSPRTATDPAPPPDDARRPSR
jgi:RNA 2',3'-cyclic 3'-phosphodiesterase